MHSPTAIPPKDAGRHCSPGILLCYTQSMTFTHAPYALLGDWVIVYAKTTKTACGRRRKTETLVPRDEATCPECRTQIEKDRNEFAKMEELAEEIKKWMGN